MTDSSMYSSLLALVESHLSKASLQDGSNRNTVSHIPCFNSLRDGSVSESLLNMQTRPRLPIPTLCTSESPIQSVLAQQVANMLIAKEKREKEERVKLEEKMKRLHVEETEKNSAIDLMQAIQTPYAPECYVNKQDSLSISSVESLFELNFTDGDSEPLRTKSLEPVLLPCITDMSYILKQKVKRGKCSAFGKVLRSRLKPVPAPYLIETIPTTVKRFDFSTPSPCDIVKANRKYRPTVSTTFTLDITKFV